MSDDRLLATHRGDPDTSRRWAAANESKYQSLAGWVLGVVEAFPMLTPSEISEALAGRGGFAADWHQRLCQVRRALSGLKHRMLLVESEDTGETETRWHLAAPPPPPTPAAPARQMSMLDSAPAPERRAPRERVSIDPREASRRRAILEQLALYPGSTAGYVAERLSTHTVFSSSRTTREHQVAASLAAMLRAGRVRMISPAGSTLSRWTVER